MAIYSCPSLLQETLLAQSPGLSGGYHPTDAARLQEAHTPMAPVARDSSLAPSWRAVACPRLRR